MKPITEFPFSPALLTDAKYWWNRRDKDSLNQPAEPSFQELLAIAQNNKKLFGLICSTLPTMDGWCSIEKGCALASLVLAIKPKVITEIGVWAGRSLLPMAWAIQENRQGLLIGIDPYSAKESAKEEFGENEKWWGNQDHDAILKKFMSIVEYFKLRPVVDLVRKRSDDVEPTPSEILHIDGSHTDQAVRDATRFGPKVPLGGIVVCDDIMWVGGGVLRAIDALEEMGFVERFRFAEQNWCIHQRTR